MLKVLTSEYREGDQAVKTTVVTFLCIPIFKYIPHGSFSNVTLDKHTQSLLKKLEFLGFAPDAIIGHFCNPTIGIINRIKSSFPRAKTAVQVGGKTTDQLTGELADIGARGMVEALAAVEAGTDSWQVQDASLVTYAAKLAKEETLLSPQLPAAACMRRIQASNHRAPARCRVCGKEVQVVEARPAAEAVEPGAVLLQKKRIVLGCAEGALELLTVKPQGKREMPVQGWLNGLRSAEPVWEAV